MFSVGKFYDLYHDDEWKLARLLKVEFDVYIYSCDGENRTTVSVSKVDANSLIRLFTNLKKCQPRLLINPDEIKISDHFQQFFTQDNHICNGENQCHWLAPNWLQLSNLKLQERNTMILNNPFLIKDISNIIIDYLEFEHLCFHNGNYFNELFF